MDTRRVGISRGWQWRTAWSDPRYGLSATTPLKAAVAISGLFDLEPVSQAQFLKPEFSLDADTIQSMSPANLQPSGPAPVWTVVGQKESSEFHRQSQLLVERWGSAIVHGPFVVDGANHFDVCDEFASSDSALFKLTLALCAD